MYKICFYVPESHLETVKNAMFDSGAGKLGPYACCSWQVLGTGQYLPLSGSRPFKGEQDQIETGAEYLVEMICQDEYVKNVISAMKKTHPYETPAYQVLKVEDF